ncbi:MAG: O-antigen ligase family protein [Dysgonamonadaceae bacterium]|jgi:tetratricopeptide (TPR) repeat protein|nr:O-antigen ligase family protein [Dysgonamonadaceae bacterium]
MKKYLDEILVFALGASVYFSALVVNDAWDNRSKLYGFGLLLVLYFLLRFILNTKCTKSIICFLIIAAGLYEVGLGLLQLYGFESSNHGLFRLTGTFFNPGPYAGFLSLVAPVSLWFLFKTNNEVKNKNSSNILKFFNVLTIIKIICGITFVIILLVLPATMSRAAWLAAIAGCLIVIYKHYESKLHLAEFYQSYKKKLYTILCCTIIVIVIALAGIYFLKKDSADGRLLTWKISLKTVVKHPLGVGLGNFSGAYGDEQAAYFASGKASETEEYVAGNPEYGFNEYLQILVESGVVAFILFIVIAFRAVKALSKHNAGLAGSLMALLVFAAFSYPFSLWEFLIMLVVLLAMKHTDNTDNRRFQLFKKSALISLISVIGVLIIYRLYPVYQANKSYKKISIYYHSGLFKEVIEVYNPLYRHLNDNTQFLFEYGRSLSMSERYEESNAVLQRATKISCDPMFYNIMGNNYKALKDIDKAEASYLKAAYIVPNRLYPWYLLMKLYSETGQTEKALKTAKTVLTKEPKVHSKAIEEMRTEAEKLKVQNES